MAQLYSTGPCSVWCGVGSSGAPLFLGHGERPPNIQIRPQWSPVQVDLGGSAEFDRTYDGEVGVVSVDLERYNESVYAILAGRPQSRLGVSARGTTVPGDIGSLMIQEGLAFQLWLSFPYSAKLAMAGMPAGYHFVAAVLAGPDSLDELGTKPRRIRLIFDCLRKFDPSVTNSLGAGGFVLYDLNMTAIAGLPIN